MGNFLSQKWRRALSMFKRGEAAKGHSTAAYKIWDAVEGEIAGQRSVFRRGMLGLSMIAAGFSFGIPAASVAGMVVAAVYGVDAIASAREIKESLSSFSVKEDLALPLRWKPALKEVLASVCLAAIPCLVASKVITDEVGKSCIGTLSLLAVMFGPDILGALKKGGQKNTAWEIAKLDIRRIRLGDALSSSISGLMLARVMEAVPLPNANNAAVIIKNLPSLIEGIAPVVGVGVSLALIPYIGGALLKSNVKHKLSMPATERTAHFHPASQAVLIKQTL